MKRSEERNKSFFFFLTISLYIGLVILDWSGN